ncbi:MAG: nucleotidyltransferase domain-containing protein [Desulfobacterales bacterium]|nr:nucleotidyltransferase domain-containing protein [Desulfobacterales bacterium]
MNKKINIPKSYEENIRRAVDILREAGCSDIFLFGSLAEDNFREGSDIDIAVRGCPRKKFFYVLGKLLRNLDYPVDMVDLDEDNDFCRFLIEEGELVRIG